LSYFTLTVPQSTGLTAYTIRTICQQFSITFRRVREENGMLTVEVFSVDACTRIERLLRARGFRLPADVRDSTPHA